MDIEVVNGSIWLAYPNRLLKSNTVRDLAAVTVWEEVMIPEGASITAMTRVVYHPRLCLLDGRMGRIHMIDDAGHELLSWDALGSDLERGDLGYFGRFGDSGTIQTLYQSDGAGTVYLFDGFGGL